MTKTYSLETINKFIRLINSFPDFLTEMGMSSDNETVEKLLSDEMYLTVAHEDRAYVIAWVTWVLEFHVEKTIMWQGITRELAVEAKNSILSLCAEMEDIRNDVLTDNVNTLILNNHSRLFTRRASECAGKGMALSHMIIDGVNPESKLWEDILAFMAPTMTFNRKAKYITVLP